MKSDDSKPLGQAKHYNPWNDPHYESPIRLELGFCEGFDYEQRERLVESVSGLFGSPIEIHDSATKEDETKREKLRGGPHIMGHTGWRVWNLDPEVIEKMAPDLSAAEMVHDLDRATFKLNWAENLPFMVGYVRLLLPRDTTIIPENLLYAMRHLVGEMFDKFPGRLSPNNRHPRVEGRWFIIAKVSEKRMEGLREAAGLSDPEPDAAAFRRHVAPIPIANKDPGSFRVFSPFSNVMVIDGPGAGFLGASHGPHTSFLYSDGNLARPDDEHTGYLPFWLPPNLSTSSEDQLPYWPFLVSAHNYAEYTLIGAGEVDERLDKHAADFEANLRLPLVKRVWRWGAIREPLLRDSGRVSRLLSRLHMSKTRSGMAQIRPFNSPGSEPVQVKATGSAWADAAEYEDIRRIYEDKGRMEKDAHELLTKQFQRIRDFLGTISSDYHWFWAMASALVATAAVIVSVLSIL